MSSIDKGRRNQLKSRRYLEDAGYAVEVAKFSRWGSTDFYNLWDMMGVNEEDIIFVQVKSNRLPSPAYRRLMEEFPVPKWCRKELHIWYDRKKEPRIINLRKENT